MMNSAFFKEEKTYFAEKLEQHTANPEKETWKSQVSQKKDQNFIYNLAIKLPAAA